MSKLVCSDYDFLSNIIIHLENGENLERAVFLLNDIPEDFLFSLQLGENLIDLLSSIEFNYPTITNLFSSINQSDLSDILERLRITARLIRNREEAILEKDNMLRIHQKRIKIIRYVTLLTIAIIGGFSPIFSNLFLFITTGAFVDSSSILSYLSIAFLFINLLNNYFLLKLSREEKILIRLSIVASLHIIIVIFIRFFYANFFAFS
ncbi:MAG: hypothetical protein ACXABK_01280 [Candidatus Heimdallarchaeaceae archaeon]|jgi:hypothetical protein